MDPSATDRGEQHICDKISVEEIHYKLFSTKSHIYCPSLSAFFESNKVWLVEKQCGEEEEEEDGMEFSLISIALSLPLFFSMAEREALRVRATGLKKQKTQRQSQFKIFWYVCEGDSVWESEWERSRCVYEEQNNVGC